MANLSKVILEPVMMGAAVHGCVEKLFSSAVRKTRMVLDRLHELRQVCDRLSMYIGVNRDP